MPTIGASWPPGSPQPAVTPLKVRSASVFVRRIIGVAAGQPPRSQHPTDTANTARPSAPGWASPVAEAAERSRPSIVNDGVDPSPGRPRVDLLHQNRRAHGNSDQELISITVRSPSLSKSTEVRAGSRTLGRTRSINDRSCETARSCSSSAASQSSPGRGRARPSQHRPADDRHRIPASGNRPHRGGDRSVQLPTAASRDQTVGLVKGHPSGLRNDVARSRHGSPRRAKWRDPQTVEQATGYRRLSQVVGRFDGYETE